MYVLTSHRVVRIVVYVLFVRRLPRLQAMRLVDGELRRALHDGDVSAAAGRLLGPVLL